MPMATLEDTGPLAPAERWPGVLAAELGAGWRVIEEGLPGRTTVYPDPVSGVHKNGLALLPAALESHRPIDLVVLMLGTNDLKQRFQVPAVEIGESVSAARAQSATATWGRAGRSRAILLVAPPPVLEAGCLAEIFAGGAAKSRGWRRPTPTWRGGTARRSSTRARSIVSSPLDGVHFDAAEHGKLGRAVAAAVRAMFSEQGLHGNRPHMEAVWNAYGMRMASKMVGIKSLTEPGSLLRLRIDRLAALQHLDEGGDALRPAGRGLHVVRAEGESEAVLGAESRQRRARRRLGVDGGLQIVGDGHLARRSA